MHSLEKIEQLHWKIHIQCAGHSFAILLPYHEKPLCACWAVLSPQLFTYMLIHLQRHGKWSSQILLSNEWKTEEVPEKQNIFKKHQTTGQNWSVWSNKKRKFLNGQVHSKTDAEQNQSLTSTQGCVKKQKTVTSSFTCKNLYLLFYYYFNAEAVVPVLIIWLNELKWDSPGSCWHNEWLCGEAQNVNDEEFWKALEFVNNKSSYSPQNLTICSQQQRRTQRPLFNKMIQKQDTKGIRGYLYWHNTASKLCPQVGRVMNACCRTYC